MLIMIFITQELQHINLFISRTRASFCSLLQHAEMEALLAPDDNGYEEEIDQELYSEEENITSFDSVPCPLCAQHGKDGCLRIDLQTWVLSCQPKSKSTCSDSTSSATCSDNTSTAPSEQKTTYSYSEQRSSAAACALETSGISVRQLVGLVYG